MDVMWSIWCKVASVLFFLITSAIFCSGEREDFGGREEQLYMMEVLLDSVVLREPDSPKREPVGELLAKIAFADFPVVEVERNQEVILRDPDRDDDLSSSTVNYQLLPGLPEEWKVKREGRGRYSVEVTYSGKESGEIKAMRVGLTEEAVAAGEGLRLLLAGLKADLEPEEYTEVEARLRKELARSKVAGQQREASYQFSAGKSFMFHMEGPELIYSISENPVKIQIYRTGIEGKQYVNTLIGEARIQLGLPFVRAVVLASTPGAILPATGNLDNTFVLEDVFGKPVGSIKLCLRLSCFGLTNQQDEEMDEMNKQTFLKQFLGDDMKYRKRKEPDLRYPWKKNLYAVQERPAPVPHVEFVMEPIDCPPPVQPPPFDFGQYFPNAPRCTPFTPPPCYRRAGDAPLSRCNREMERQLKREESTRYVQTEVPGEAPQGIEEGPCTCHSIPPQIMPSGNFSLKCTCAEIIKCLGTCGGANSQDTTSPVTDCKDIQLTKPDCGLEKKPETAETKHAESEPKPEKTETPQEIPQPKRRSHIAQEEDKKEEEKRQISSRKETEAQSVFDNRQKKSSSQETIQKHPEKKDKEPSLDNQDGKVSEKPKISEVEEKVENNTQEIIEQENMPKESTEIHDREDDFHYDDEYFDEFDEEAAEQNHKPKTKKLYEKTPGMYPGRYYGHRKCVTEQQLVPKNMGWLWTSTDFGKRRVWRPGTIRGDVSNMLNKAKERENDISDKAIETFQTKYKTSKSKVHAKQPPSKQAPEQKLNPNLHIHKKEGYYYVSLMPVKTESQEDKGEEPKPIEYKLDPKHPEGDEGNLWEYSSDSSSDCKSYELNFIVPLALQTRMKKPDKSNKEAQYNELDFAKKGGKKQQVPPAQPPPAPEQPSPARTTKQKKGDKGKKGKGKGK